MTYQKVNVTPGWMCYAVELDGEPVPNAIEADDEVGYVVVFVRADYPPNVEPIVVTERREGRVRLIDVRGERTGGAG
jgi:hypothetical protein